VSGLASSSEEDRTSEVRLQSRTSAVRISVSVQVSISARMVAKTSGFAEAHFTRCGLGNIQSHLLFCVRVTRAGFGHRSNALTRAD
jgi:hypothetical protein